MKTRPLLVERARDRLPSWTSNGGAKRRASGFLVIDRSQRAVHRRTWRCRASLDDPLCGGQADGAHWPPVIGIAVEIGIPPLSIERRRQRT